jgi:hypothetical protein
MRACSFIRKLDVYEAYIHHASPVAADSVRVCFIGDLPLADGGATLTEAMVGTAPSSEDLQQAVLSSQSEVCCF